MGMPWVILSRGVRVRLVPGGVEAEEEGSQHVGPVEGAQHVGVGSVQAEEEARREEGSQHVGPVEEAQHVGVGSVQAEEEDKAPQRGVQAGKEQAEHAAAAAELDFIFSIAPPPGVAVLAVGHRALPEPDPEKAPNIVAAGSSCILVHFPAAPSHDDRFVVLRDFHTAEGRRTASAEPIPHRTGRKPNLNVGSVALSTNHDSGGYMITELQVRQDCNRASLFSFLGSRPSEGWFSREVGYPLAPEKRSWLPHGALEADGRVWWFDLSWGILSYSAAHGQEGLLCFHPLPEGRGLVRDTVEIETKRCVTASLNRLRYAEIITDGESATVLMWTLVENKEGWSWHRKHRMKFFKLWDHISYRKADLAPKVPALITISPLDPHLVYFAQDQRLFGVDVRAHRVVHDQLVNIQGPPRLDSGRYFVAWDLPSTFARAETRHGNELSNAASSITAQAILQERAAASTSAARGALPSDLCFGTVDRSLLSLPPNLSIVDIWEDGVESAFKELEITIGRDVSLLVGIDTEFCRMDGITDPRGEPMSMDAHYQQAHRIVDEGDLIQVGLVVSDADLVVFPNKIYQFNLQFDSSSRNRDSANVEFLQTEAKLKLEEHEERGIPVHHFFEKLLRSRMLGDTRITWITFQGYSDFGYLITGAENISCLPQRREDFLALIQKHFPRSYDLKVFHQLGVCCTQPSGKKGSRTFQALADSLGVARIGQAHGAGSDAHLSLACFHHMLLSHPISEQVIWQYRNIVYGVSLSIPSPFGGVALNPTEIHVWDSDLDNQAKLFSKLFGTYSSGVTVSVEIQLNNHVTASSGLSSYGAERKNAALSGPLELGIAIDSAGSLAYGRIWTFHIQGKNQLLGNRIRPSRLAHFLTATGGILNPNITWLSSRTAAFLYMVKAFSSSDCLPLNRQGFLSLISVICPSLFLVQVTSQEINPALRALANLRSFFSKEDLIWSWLYDLVD